MGDRTYAEQMVALLDPRRVLFADRIVSSVGHLALLALLHIKFSVLSRHELVISQFEIVQTCCAYRGKDKASPKSLLQ